MIKTFAKDGMKIAVGITMLIAFLMLLGAAVFVELKNKDVVILLIGNVMGAVLTIVSYYWGSSKGSDTKTQIIADKMGEDK